MNEMNNFMTDETAFRAVLYIYSFLNVNQLSLISQTLYILCILFKMELLFAFPCCFLQNSSCSCSSHVCGLDDHLDFDMLIGLG